MVRATRGDLRFTVSLPLDRPRKEGRRCGSSARAASESSSRSGSGGGGGGGSGKNKSKGCAATTAALRDALSVFTRLFVLCRRCRRPYTALFASEENNSNRPSTRRNGCPSSAPGRGGRGSGGDGRREGGLALWVECQADGCGVTSWVGVAAGYGAGGGGGGDGGGCAEPPLWLVLFARYVLNRGWKVRQEER